MRFNITNDVTHNSDNAISNNIVYAEYERYHGSLTQMYDRADPTKRIGKYVIQIAYMDSVKNELKMKREKKKMWHRGKKFKNKINGKRNKREK